MRRRRPDSAAGQRRESDPAARRPRLGRALRRRDGPRSFGLGARIALLAVSVALLTSAAGGVISVNLLQRASEQTARAALVAVADQAAATAQVGASAEGAQARARKALQSLNVQVAVVRTRPGGPPFLVGDQLAVRALTPDQTARLAAGEQLSLRLPRQDGAVLVEARPTPAGGIVLAQRRGDAVALAGQALRQLTLLLVVVGVAAVVLALLVAWRLARPLKRTAAAAAALAEGSRDIAIPETGPRELAEVAASVNRLARALSHSEARQREFLLSVSHDLRTPLTAITGYAESLADGVVPPERLQSVGTVIGDEARRLERLVADLLDLARLDAAEMRMLPAPVDVVALVSGAAETWGHRCERAQVELRVESPDHAVVVHADAQRLRQALDGLIENALRVTPQGAPIVVATRTEPGDVAVEPGDVAVEPSDVAVEPGDVAVEPGDVAVEPGDVAVEPGDVAVLEVRDGGPGLGDEDLPVAFERSVLYEKYRGVRQVGTGLGLAIVHRIVERLGGSVEAGHAPEGGARFTIRLPLAATSLPAQPGQTPAQPRQTQASASQTPASRSTRNTVR